MKIETSSTTEFISKLPEDRKEAMSKLRQTILKDLLKDFSEGITYYMNGYFFPHSLYLAGYHCDPKQPLHFMKIASQKNFIALYHMGMFANRKMLDTGYKILK